MILAGATALAIAGTPAATPVVQGAAVDAAVAACEQWLLNPATWADEINRFPQASGLASRGLTLQAAVPDVALPPPSFRRAMHHWRVPIGAGGVFVTVSDQQPVCHLAGGGPEDLAPGIAAALGSPSFLSRWKATHDGKRGKLRTTSYVNKVDPKLSMVVTRATASGAPTDRVQFLATAQYKIGK